MQRFGVRSVGHAGIQHYWVYDNINRGYVGGSHHTTHEDALKSARHWEDDRYANDRGNIFLYKDIDSFGRGLDKFYVVMADLAEG